MFWKPYTFLKKELKKEEDKYIPVCLFSVGLVLILGPICASCFCGIADVQCRDARGSQCEVILLSAHSAK